MSFLAKEDYVGIGVNGLSCRSNAENASNNVLPINGSDGSILSDYITGHVKAPTCEYAITKEVNLSTITLGAVKNAPYAVSRLHVTTGAGSEPVVQADAVQIESGASKTICTYKVDPITISPARHAITFGAFTFTESVDQTLQNVEFEATANIQPATVNNEPVASDSTAGTQTVSITMWTTGSQPTITVSNGWHQTGDWSCTGNDGALFVWTATLTKYLTTNE